jgi:hypothetical protein
MNETNELEMRLRSWVPRHPSAKLKQKIFGAPSVTAPTPETPAFRLSWLAPATATLFLMCLLFNQRNNPAMSTGGSSGPIMAMILSNQSAAYLPGSFQSDQNRLPADTFEWTNAGSSTSSIRSLFLQKGN